MWKNVPKKMNPRETSQLAFKQPRLAVGTPARHKLLVEFDAEAGAGR